ncbi:MAG: SH3 domain-containing protein [Oscillibacter sp.]|nr:M15 family metallopeptidase [uncultured Oscillibacter sp.]MCI8970371.1 SH3 domain-containing protein [Oscillibacter sp.]
MKRIWIPAAVLALAALTAAYFYIPSGVRPSFGEGDLRICLNGDGTASLSWPEARLEVPAEAPPEAPPGDGDALPEETPEEAGSPVFYQVDIKHGDQHLQLLPDGPGVLCQDLAPPMKIRIRAVTEGKNFLGLSRTLTGQTLTAEVAETDLSAPEAVGMPEAGKLVLSWKQEGQDPDFYEISALEGGQSVRTITAQGKQALLKVSKRDGDLVLPSRAHPLEVQVRAAVRGEGYVLCGPASNTVSVERQDLLGTELNLFHQETAPRTYTLEWDETKGESYRLYEQFGEEWTLLDTLEPAETLTYALGRLDSGSLHHYMVEAIDRGGDVLSSEILPFYASVDPLYATVWPIIDQPFYEKADGESASLGKIPGGTALCVLEESGDWFQVRYKDQYGWVDSRFCMINLPEYVGDYCAYDITNSYRSVFKVHESPIALITDQVVQGFEHIQTEDGQFLVPYLYPCARKLLRAAQAAEADGYRLKIYEAFRPNEATRFLYDTTAAQLDWAALVYDEEAEQNADGSYPAVDPVTGWVVDLSDGLLIDPETGEKISREDLALRLAEEAEKAASLEEGLMLGAIVPEEETPPQDGAAPETPEPSQPFFTLPEDGEGSGLEPAPQPEPVPQPGASEAQAHQEGDSPEEGAEAPEYDTYFQIMTNNGRFGLGSFLARVTSAHNRGIALDLTLERRASGQELEMQSAIHDLSWYSAAYLNNDSAKLLEKYMTGVGMRGLSSEWWHFQDDETREAIGLTSYLFKGVDLSGWTRDDRGWRYRNADGGIYKNTSVTVDGKRYTVDQDGYISE